MFNTERLSALAAVAEHGTIADAARARHVTPSGLSQQLAKLEREAGQPLLEPYGRTVRLTHAGRVLAGHATRVLAQLAEARGDLAELSGQVLGPLRLGGVGSAIRALLPGPLAALSAAHPRLEATVCDGEVVELMPALLNGDLDLLLVESWSSRPLAFPSGVATVPLVDEPVSVALPAGHRLSGRARVDPAELGQESWASCPPGTEPYEATLQALRGRGVEPRVRYALKELPTQLALVAAGVAVALVPDLGRRPAPEGVVFRPLDPPVRRTIRAVWRVDAETPAVRACAGALTAQAAEWGADGGAGPAADPGADAVTPRRAERASG
ncbi:LysR family transcriptional regulator [Nocardiopsis sp. YSL2]|uniref:LysR family transcriptional regulator n=1 Tax=Nocardiopsis sp. YSL2 TaxID=2939492 RepID=UPI0026F4512A|nr:LysR family transcriptional regulator [Nocardiopsis sp. YSL2]